jgi:tRNA wybutosine-synthesizing protein 5
MNMQPRNYAFRTVGMQELLAAGRSDTCTGVGAGAAKEFMYLRSVGADARKHVADMATTFPGLAPDVRVPDFVPASTQFSSVLRVSSPGLQLWPHFDVADNFLVHVRGRKKVTVWAPAHAGALGIAPAPDASSAPFTRIPAAGDGDAEADAADGGAVAAPPARYMSSAHAQRLEGVLEPGDVLFLPAFWLHHVVTLPGDVAVSVNVFWRHLLSEAYAGKDVYGNKDVLAGAQTLALAQRAAAALRALPVGVYRDFYGLRGVELLCETLRPSAQGDAADSDAQDA